MLATKLFYFGNGGGVYEFVDFVNWNGVFNIRTAKELNNKVGGN